MIQSKVSLKNSVVAKHSHRSNGRNNMGFSRSFLKATGLTDEQITAVMEEHTAVTDALKKQRDDYKADADKAAELQKQLDGMKGGEDFKKKYEDEHKAFEDFKKETAQNAEAAKVRAAYRKLLIEEKIGEKRLDSILKVTDFSKMKLDKDGSLHDADKLTEGITAKYAKFIVTEGEKTPPVKTPPDGQPKTMTRADVWAKDDKGRYKLSTEERQKALTEHPELMRPGT